MSDDVELLKRGMTSLIAATWRASSPPCIPFIWTNGMEGGHVHGRDEVRSYWKRQWSILNPHVEPVEILSNGKVGYCRSEVYFSDLCLVAAKVQPAVYARSKRSMALRSGSHPVITSKSKAIRYPQRYVAHAGCRVDGLFFK
jgi:hypothetical protein